MANPEHVDWLLQGADSWNARRRESQFRPDLSEEDISKKFYPGPFSELATALSPIDLKRANLSEADLHNSIFTGIDVTKGSLSNTDFTGANLIASNLSETFGMNAQFVEAVLQFVNLSNFSILFFKFF